MIDPECKVERVSDKHERLSDEVKSINNVCRQLRALIGRIKCEPNGEEVEEPESHTPSFLDVLDGSPTYINEKVATCQKLIGEIEELLF